MTSVRGAGGGGALDLGTTFAFVEADAPRVRCRRHGVVVVAVPWARHDSRFTRVFEDQVAWLVVNTSKTAVAAAMRVAWRSVGSILERVAAEARREVDLLAGLRRIGIDEISHRKGQRYLTVVVDHHSGRLVWAAPGRDRTTVLAFFDALGEERCKQLELISADMASWISGPIAERASQAIRCVDPFHVVMLASEALDEVRREVWNEARRQGNLELARELKGARADASRARPGRSRAWVLGFSSSKDVAPRRQFRCPGLRAMRGCGRRSRNVRAAMDAGLGFWARRWLDSAARRGTGDAVAVAAPVAEKRVGRCTRYQTSGTRRLWCAAYAR
jgi:transposase